MSPFAGPLFAASVLLLIAGANKVLRPAPTRVALRTAGLPSRTIVARGIGGAEVVIAAAALAVGGRVPAALVTLAYLGFTGFSIRLHRASRGAAPCGCFGASDAPVGPIHIGVDLAIAAVVAGAIVWPSSGLLGAVSDTPWAGIPFFALTWLLVGLLQASLTVLPATLAAAKPSPAGAAA